MVRKDRASQEDPDCGRAAACMATCRSRPEARGENLGTTGRVSDTVLPHGRIEPRFARAFPQSAWSMVLVSDRNHRWMPKTAGLPAIAQDSDPLGRTASVAGVGVHQHGSNPVPSWVQKVRSQPVAAPEMGRAFSGGQSSCGSAVSPQNDGALHRRSLK